MRPDSRDELARREADRGFLLRSIADLDNERAAGDLDNEDYTRLRAKYDARLAMLNGDITAGKAALAKKPARNPLRTLTWVGVVTVCAVAAGVLVSRSAGQRLPSDTVTGGNVRDANQLLVEARSALGTDRPAALARFRQVLETQPDNAEARTYAGWITRLDTKAAVDAGKLTVEAARPTFEAVDLEFERAAGAAQGYADPRCFQAVLRFRDLADVLKAQTSYQACLSANPNQMVLGLVSKVGPEIDLALSTNSDPIISGLAKARIARDAKNIRDAIVAYDTVTRLDPANVESQTWSAWLLANGIVTAQRAGQISDELATDRLAKAEATLDWVLTTNPTAPDTACAKAVLAFNRQDPAAAAPALAICRAGGATTELHDTALRLAAG